MVNQFRSNNSSLHSTSICKLIACIAITLQVAAASISEFTSPIHKVTVVGGTHGNEYTGIWCVKMIERQRELYSSGTSIDDDTTKSINPFEKYPSLTINTLIANTKAYMENKRFIDTDLNREFSITKLKEYALRSCSDESKECLESSEPLPYEAVRAAEIQSLLGEKTDGDVNDAPSDIVVDLHTTTANMGITLIITEGDALMSAAAAYVMHKCKEKYGYEKVNCMLLPPNKRSDRTHLPSCGSLDFTIEVGPTPQGVLRHDVVEQTQAALNSLLEFLHLRNVEFANNNESEDTSILDELKTIYPNGVTCYRSAQAKHGQELHGKLTWTSVEDNPNFPALMIHKSVQDRDFELLRIGDPLFVALDGSVIPYDGSQGDEVLVMFVNEGGYYYAKSGTGIGLAVKSTFDWRTGKLIE